MDRPTICFPTQIVDGGPGARESRVSKMRKLTQVQENVLRTIGEHPGCKPEGREAEQLRRFGLVELDAPTSTSLIGYRLTEAGREYLDNC